MFVPAALFAFEEEKQMHISYEEAISRCWAEVDLGTVAQNYRNALDHIRGNAQIIGVLKADAYGLGAPEVAKRLWKEGMKTCAVASYNEAAAVKAAQPEMDVLILGLAGEAQLVKAIEAGMLITVFSPAYAETVARAAETAGISSYIETLPDGYDTVLSDDGVNISKGQKQLLTISRAMLSKAPILILDEATSNVDSRTEQAIQAAMNRLMVGRTSFVIAHRLSTIQNADLILVIRDGNIVEQGTHQELLAQNGVYHGLYHSQFES
jgi:ABC-type Na+ transport system ATPase subunit NatA